jgi:hypothetical protein
MKQEKYETRFPKPSNAIDLFEGEWSCDIPAFSRGRTRFFDDPRIGLWEDAAGGFAGKRILELGPLEASHTYVLERRGAADILAIEANAHAFLRCLVVKELLGLKARFLLGDFCKYLRASTTTFDLILASGVIYHMMEPLSLIENLTKNSAVIAVWTHYYDREILTGHKEINRKYTHVPVAATFHGANIDLYEQSYFDVIQRPGFCGGIETTSMWLTRPGIETAFDRLGFEVQVVLEEPSHSNGPAFAFVAKRRNSSA